MIDAILEHQPDWRYCNVKAGEKVPYPARWQQNPLTLDQVESSNIGLMFGPNANGIMAIDFDGTTAWQWIKDQGVSNLPKTPTWASGKTDRCQMAFRVPQEYWHVLATKKQQTKPPSAPGARDGEGFEFRWTGGQSVLPPSIHPDTQKPYVWLVDATTPTATVPDSILEAWLSLMSKHRDVFVDTTPERTLDDLDQYLINEADSILKILKSKKPALGYDEWRSVCWGIAHHVGRDAAGVLMRTYYPEQRGGEYVGLFRGWNKSKSPTLGTVRFLAGFAGK